MLEDIALNDLISGKPKVSDITQNEKIPPEGYKLTGRVNRLKNYNTYETIIFNQFTGKKMTLSIKAQDKEDIPLLILRLLTLGGLNTLFTSSSSSASPSEVPTFAEFATDIFTEGGRYARRRELKERPITPKDLQAADRAIKRIVKAWGKYRLDEFNMVAVHEKLIYYLRYESRVGKQIKYSKLKPKERNAKTVENLLSYMSIVFNFAVEDGLISVNPIPSVKKLLPANRRNSTYQAIPMIAVKKLFSEKEIWRDYFSFVMFLFLILTGVRIGEAASLKVKDFDLDKRTFYISQTYKGGGYEKATKTFTPRKVPLCNLLYFALKPLLSRSKNSYVFSLDGKRPFSYGKFYTAFLKAMDEVGLTKPIRVKESYVIHSLRRNFISSLVAAGVSDALISLITGHDTVKLSSMNLRYSELLDEAVPSLIEKIDGIFDGETVDRIKSVALSLCPYIWRRVWTSEEVEDVQAI